MNAGERTQLRISYFPSSQTNLFLFPLRETLVRPFHYTATDTSHLDSLIDLTLWCECVCINEHGVAFADSLLCLTYKSVNPS